MLMRIISILEYYRHMAKKRGHNEVSSEKSAHWLGQGKNSYVYRGLLMKHHLIQVC